MPKNRSENKKINLPNENSKTCVMMDKSNNILINVVAKPGAKQNNITDISNEGISIQINAPPTEGEANIELMKYISKILGISKGNIEIHRGFKSRQKTLKITTDSYTFDDIENKLRKAMAET